MLAAIWAQDEQGIIGVNNHLPWYLPNDLKFFKAMTENHTIVLGKKTFEGMNEKPLPNRKTIVLTTDTTYAPANISVMHSIDDVLNYVKNSKELVFIAGGSKIYQEFLPYCDVLYRTVIKHSFTGDRYFPFVDWSAWALSSITQGVLDKDNPYPYQFEVYHKLETS